MMTCLQLWEGDYAYTIIQLQLGNYKIYQDRTPSSAGSVIHNTPESKRITPRSSPVDSAQSEIPTRNDG